MRLEDARIEVLDRVSKLCGYTITEKDLSPAARQSINSLAMVFRQLVMTKQLLMVEQKGYDRLSLRVARVVSGSDHGGYSKHIAQLTNSKKTWTRKYMRLPKKYLRSFSPSGSLILEHPRSSRSYLTLCLSL